MHVRPLYFNGCKMTKNDTISKRHITALKDDAYSALEDAAEKDMRGEAHQPRYLIVQGLRRRNVPGNHQDGETEDW